MTTARTHYRGGNLDAALEAAAAELRDQPNDVAKRAFFVELLCLRGEFEKADQQLQTLLSLAPDTAITVGTWRQLVHAAQARRDVFENGRVPDFIDGPSERMAQHLELLVALHDGNTVRAAELGEMLEAQRAPLAASINERAVNDLRDPDDLTAGILEVLASNGKYFWVEFSQVVEMVFEPPQRPLDLLWRKASIVLNTGTEGEVFIPAIYPTTGDDAEARLGRRTDWREDGGVVRGIGQRLWLADDDIMPLTEITTLAVASTMADAE